MKIDRTQNSHNERFGVLLLLLLIFSNIFFPRPFFLHRNSLADYLKLYAFALDPIQIFRSGKKGSMRSRAFQFFWLENFTLNENSFVEPNSLHRCSAHNFILFVWQPKTSAIIHWGAGKSGVFPRRELPPPPSLSLSLWDFLLHCHHHQHIRVLNLIQFKIKSHYRKPYLPNAFFLAKLFSPTNSLDQKIWGLSHLARIKGDFVWMTICCFVYRVYFLPFVSWNTYSHSHAHTQPNAHVKYNENTLWWY